MCLNCVISQSERFECLQVWLFIYVFLSLMQTICQKDNVLPKDLCSMSVYNVCVGRRLITKATCSTHSRIYFKMCFKVDWRVFELEGTWRMATFSIRIIFHPNCQRPLSGCGSRQNTADFLPTLSLTAYLPHSLVSCANVIFSCLLLPWHHCWGAVSRSMSSFAVQFWKLMSNE